MHFQREREKIGVFPFCNLRYCHGHLEVLYGREISRKKREQNLLGATGVGDEKKKKRESKSGSAAETNSILQLDLDQKSGFQLSMHQVKRVQRTLAGTIEEYRVP